MNLYIFIEVDNNNNAKYLKKYNKIANLASDVFVLTTREYSQDENSKTFIIPDSVIEEIDANCGSVFTREQVLRTGECAEFEKYLKHLLEDNKVDMVVSNEKYECVKKITDLCDIELCVTANDNEENSNEMTELLRLYIADKKKTIKMDDEINQLHSDIRSKDELIQRLQEKVNALDKEIYRKNQKSLRHNEEIRGYEQRLEKTENMKFLYLDMYKELLKELDRVKTKLLDNGIV